MSHSTAVVKKVVRSEMHFVFVKAAIFFHTTSDVKEAGERFREKRENIPSESNLKTKTTILRHLPNREKMGF